MKFNTKKIIVPTLALIAGASLVGSISGTVAWYQYSTRTTAAYVGTSASATRNLQIKVDGGEFKSDIPASEIKDYLDNHGSNDNLKPVTTGKQAKDEALNSFKGNPVYQYEDMAKWKQTLVTDTVVIPLSFKLTDSDAANIKQKRIYISQLEIKHITVTGKADVSSAIRVQINSGTGTSALNSLFAKGENGTASTVETVTHGALDLNGDGEADKKPGFIYDDNEYASRDDADYGSLENGVAIDAATNKQVAYNTLHAANFVDDSDSNLQPTGSEVYVGTTNDSGELSTTVSIWMEGWQSIGSKLVWDEDTIGSKFGVGMRFCVDSDFDN